ncbi:TatD family hydrolase [Alkalimarinus alittae]|uniref:TatD family hydrolase n=1 Tax=Alkalimarinus alittae TaxID=2961619 RepID=A0ABY6N0L2_9ALTE|nr:TatD family hydrolase [Alkalimarinus alittae]UZE95580.1 TatD family hydrolase [Alkalimarinus alittae]
MIYADAHCHLDFDVFDVDRAELILRCHSLGVKMFVVPGVERNRWSKVLQVSAQYSAVYPCLGLHPCFLDAHTEGDVATLECLLEKHKEIVAIGEIGLDLSKPDLNRQLVFFEQQVELANKFKLPVVMHSRKAHNQIIEVLKRKPLVAGGLLHGFSGSLEQAVRFWEAGVYLGLGGVITYERAQKTRKTFAKLPLEAIILETDSPDMPLSGMQGGRNTPLNIPLIHKAFCALRPEADDVVNRQLMDNASNLFGIIGY